MCKKLIILLVLALSFIPFSTITNANTTNTNNTTRLSGQTRFETAKAISEYYNQGKVNNVILTTGNEFADALSASVLAHQKNAPILLADLTVDDSKDAFDYITQHLIQSGTVYIIGGTGAVNNDFEIKLNSFGFNNVVRIAGSDRYDTSYKIAESLSSDVSAIAICSGESFPDALSIASFAANKEWPILLTPKDVLPQEMKGCLLEKNPSKVYIIGGTGVISDNIKNEIGSLLPQANIERLAGQDGFDTNATVAQTFAPNPTTIYLATGYSFADALAGSTLAAKNGNPIILIDPSSPTLPKSVASYFEILSARKSNPNIIVFGGSGAVSDEMMKNSSDSLTNHYLSLSSNTKEKLSVSFDASWSSSNANVDISDDGWVYTKALSGRATITATEKPPGSRVETFQITIVPWSANKISLDCDKIYDKEYIMSVDEHTGTIYYSVRGNDNVDLYASTDGMKTSTKVSTLPAGQIIAPMLITPNGYFMQSLYNIYYSKDLSSWKAVCSIGYTSLKDAFSYYYDSTTGKTYVYCGNYYTNTAGTYEPKVYRVIMNSDATYTASTCLTFYSRSEYNSNSSLSPAAWHVHVISVDPSNGYVYVGTGDSNNEASILVSKDNGTTWTIIGVGDTEAYRTLSIWFTKGYMYWSMDSSDVQHIYRVPKGCMDLSQKQTVVILQSGSMWYHMWIKDDHGDDVVLLSSSAEGLRQDDGARVWYIKENSDTTVQVEEALLIPRTSTDAYYLYRQFVPYIQDSNGYIYGNYWKGVQAEDFTRKYRLIRR